MLQQPLFEHFPDELINIVDDYHKKPISVTTSHSFENLSSKYRSCVFNNAKTNKQEVLINLYDGPRSGVWSFPFSIDDICDTKLVHGNINCFTIDNNCNTLYAFKDYQIQTIDLETGKSRYFANNFEYTFDSAFDQQTNLLWELQNDGSIRCYDKSGKIIMSPNIPRVKSLFMVDGKVFVLRRPKKIEEMTKTQYRKSYELCEFSHDGVFMKTMLSFCLPSFKSATYDPEYNTLFVCSEDKFKKIYEVLQINKDKQKKLKINCGEINEFGGINILDWHYSLCVNDDKGVHFLV